VSFRFLSFHRRHGRIKGWSKVAMISARASMSTSVPATTILIGSAPIVSFRHRLERSTSPSGTRRRAKNAMISSRDIHGLRLALERQLSTIEIFECVILGHAISSLDG
jgi:hypothetical protein